MWGFTKQLSVAEINVAQKLCLGFLPQTLCTYWEKVFFYEKKFVRSSFESKNTYVLTQRKQQTCHQKSYRQFTERGDWCRLRLGISLRHALLMSILTSSIVHKIRKTLYKRLIRCSLRYDCSWFPRIEHRIKEWVKCHRNYKYWFYGNSCEVQIFTWSIWRL